VRYHVKPEVVDAVQWVGTNVQEVVDFITQSMPPGSGLKSVRFEFSDNVPTTLTVSTQDGAAVLTANGNDYIMRDASGKVVAIKADVFTATYDPET